MAGSLSQIFAMLWNGRAISCGLSTATRSDGATAAAVQEITQSKDGMIRIKMHPKLPALLQLIDHLNAAEELAKNQPAFKQSSAEKVIDFRAAREYYSKLSGQE